jgi:hypothetical protein
MLIGCDGGGSGPERFDLSGAVNFDGKPVPFGQIVFEPDSSAGNSGPQGFAEIRDGKYDTKAGGKGTVGGAHVIRITGSEGESRDENNPAEVLFSDYETTADLPKEDSTKDFDVPPDAATFGPADSGRPIDDV